MVETENDETPFKQDQTQNDQSIEIQLLSPYADGSFNFENK